MHLRPKEREREAADQCGVKAAVLLPHVIAADSAGIHAAWLPWDFQPAQTEVNYKLKRRFHLLSSILHKSSFTRFLEAEL